MKAAELRKSILQAAVEGKLVPQNPNDEPASVLLERIKQGKEQLIRDGKIKKDKPLPPISTDEIPFDLPEGWIWVRLGELGVTQTGTTPSADKQIYLGNHIPFIKPADISSAGIDYENEGLSKEGIKMGRLIEFPAILMVCIGGSIGKCYITDIDVSCNQQVNAITTFIHEMQEYVWFVLSSEFSYQNIIKVASGTATPIINKDKWSKLLIPLPPLAEQRRINAKAHKLLDLNSELAVIENDLDVLENQFVEYLPKSILQAAVQGKLVAQDPNNELATELLKRIKQEKEGLVRDGKIKKDKSLPPISEDEIPYDLPAGWVWCRLEDFCLVARGGSPRPIQDFLTDNADGLNWIKIGDTDKNDKYINTTKEKIKREGLKKTRQVYKGDFLLTNSMSFGRPYILNIDGCIHDGWLVLSGYQGAVDTDFFYYALSSDFAFQQFKGSVSGSVVKNLNSDKVAKSLFPLPPLVEQQRIVAKVDELMAMCDGLKSAHTTPVLRDAVEVANIVPFPQKSRTKPIVDRSAPIALAARGDATEGLSEKANRDADELLGDD